MDSQGLPLGVLAHSANESDSKASAQLIEEVCAVYDTLQFAHVDNGYKGDATTLLQQRGLAVTVPPRVGKGFAVQPVRWRVERTIAWLKNYRRLCSDFERTVRSSEAFVWLAGIAMRLRRICRSPVVWKNRRKN